MKSELHPSYEVTTITCACGNVIHTRSTKKTSAWRFVPNVIRSLPGTRSFLTPPDVSNVLPNGMEPKGKINKHEAGKLAKIEERYGELESFWSTRRASTIKVSTRN